jgi:beta-lactamase class A
VPASAPASAPAPDLAKAAPPNAAAPAAAPPAASSTPARNRELEQAVLTSFEGLPRGASAVFQSLNGPERVELDAVVQAPAASTIKLPIMIEVMRQAQEGMVSLNEPHTITRDRVVGGTGVLQNQVGRTLTMREVLETAITRSDNVGGNLLVGIVGMQSVNQTMRSLGYPQTRISRAFMDTEAQRRGLENLTSARDMAAMLQAIYEGSLVSPAASAEMLRMLKVRGEQNDRGLDFIGRRLNPRPTIAHLNGSFTGIRNEAAIVEQDGRAYVLTIFLRGQTDEAAAEEAIARASEQIWNAVRSGVGG